MTSTSNGDLGNQSYQLFNKIGRNVNASGPNNYLNVEGTSRIRIKKQGIYFIIASFFMDKSFATTNAEVTLKAFYSDGSGGNIIAFSNFYVGTCAHTAVIQCIANLAQDAYLEIYHIGKCADFNLSMFRIK